MNYENESLGAAGASDSRCRLQTPKECELISALWARIELIWPKTFEIPDPGRAPRGIMCLLLSGSPPCDNDGAEPPKLPLRALKYVIGPAAPSAYPACGRWAARKAG